MSLAVGVKRLDDLIAYQRALEFKAEVYRIARESDRVQRDDQFRAQLLNATASIAANIAEGWGRFSASEFCQFLRYARASVEESRVWLEDGVARGYFGAATIDPAINRARQCEAAIMGLWRSLQPFTKKK